MASLPPEIISNHILCRLPVKTLLQLRCISKSWCAEIDSPHFINLHLSHSIATISNSSKVVQIDDTMYFLEDPLVKFSKLEIPMYGYDNIIMRNTCNGLLLLHYHNPYKNHEAFILFNPSTRNKMVLPTPPSENRKYANTCSSYFLGYDTINDDYKVFIISIFRDSTFSFTGCEARVYSLKSNSWRLIMDFAPREIIRSACWEGLHAIDSYVNGALHSVYDLPTCIIAFDVGKESFKQIPFPDSKEYLKVIEIYAFQECLALSCQHSGYHTDIRVMREYGVKESWTWLLSVEPEGLLTAVRPIVYSKSHNEILLSYVSYYHRELLRYDLKKKSVRGFELNGLLRSDQVVCVESLVPIGDLWETNEKNNQLGDEKIKGAMVKKKSGMHWKLFSNWWSGKTDEKKNQKGEEKMKGGMVKKKRCH